MRMLRLSSPLPPNIKFDVWGRGGEDNVMILPSRTGVYFANTCSSSNCNIIVMAIVMVIVTVILVVRAMTAEFERPDERLLHGPRPELPCKGTDGRP